MIIFRSIQFETAIETVLAGNTLSPDRVEDSCFTVSVSDAEMDDWDLQISDALEFLRVHHTDFAALSAFTNDEVGVLDFAVNLFEVFAQSRVLPADLMKLVGELKINIELSFYAVSEEKEA